MTSQEYNNQFSEEELENEVWKDVPGYEGYYQASNLGRVKSLKRKVKCNWKNKERMSIERLLRPTPSRKDKRYRVDLNKSSERKMCLVSQLILLSFVGPRPEGFEGCHNDGNLSNNRLTNLRWDTPKNNQADRVKHGTSNRGERCGAHKLTEVQVLEIRELYKTGRYTQVKLGFIYGVTDSTIRGIVNNRHWVWLH